jgi:hypothetical protein
MAARRSPRRKLDTDVDAAMKRILNEYQDFLAAATDADDEKRSKAFASRHAAGRIALSHLEDLMKLAGEEAAEEMVEVANRYLSEWRARLAQPAEAEPEIDGATD